MSDFKLGLPQAGGNVGLAKHLLPPSTDSWLTCKSPDGHLLVIIVVHKVVSAGICFTLVRLATVQPPFSHGSFMVLSHSAWPGEVGLEWVHCYCPPLFYRESISKFHTVHDCHRTRTVTWVILYRVYPPWFTEIPCDVNRKKSQAKTSRWIYPTRNGNFFDGLGINCVIPFILLIPHSPPKFFI